MSSIIEGYNYDIFISYRQKDNKHDGWVTEFVNQLKGELEATFKEDISIYFDENPHDGLLETHSVDKSLEGKLRCLLFIPIISQTYCDSKSFAWQHEFVAFNKLAKEDKFGRDIKLSSGNVASRILPVKIHDLDPEDKTLIENELGGFIRGIEFIYNEPGVNRPLKPEDDEKKNLNGTKFLNQINKVANAVKEIINSMKKYSSHDLDISNESVKVNVGHPKNQRTKIITGSILILALIVFGYLFIPKLLKPSEQLEKSIAVLPFRNDSPNDSTTYFLNGVMEEILNNLQKISDFSRVLSRNSVEQFRNNTTQSTPEIAKKLNVNYIVEGSGQKYGNKFVLRVQLIVGNNEKHLWGKSYKKEIRETSDIISIQSEIAQSIAAELKSIITPEEKQLIEKTPTENLTAYDFYQRAEEEFRKYDQNNPTTERSIKKAKDLYNEAVNCDSTFAKAYIGLAKVYWNEHLSYNEYFSKDFLDSVLVLINIALSHDDQLDEAHTYKGYYYKEKGNPEIAINEFDKALKINPNSWEAYYGKAALYYNDDLVNTIDNLQKAASHNHGSELPNMLRELAVWYFQAGFPEKGNYYNLEFLKLGRDSIGYLTNLAIYEADCNSDYRKALNLVERIYRIDSTNIEIDRLFGLYYLYSDQYERSLKYLQKYIEKLEALGKFDYRQMDEMQRIGYAYWQNGYKKEGNYYFDKQLDFCNNLINSNRPYAKSFYTYYDRAGVYAFRGNIQKAYNDLRVFSQRQRHGLWMVNLIKKDPLFNSIRNEPEFQQVVKDVEAKYQAEHERVRKWMEENKTL